jgi:hypothetical protein
MSRLERTAARLRPALLLAFMLTVFGTVSGGSSPGWASRLLADGRDAPARQAAPESLPGASAGCPKREPGLARVVPGTFTLF